MQEAGEASSSYDHNAQQTSGINADAIVQTSGTTEAALLRALQCQYAQQREHFDEVRVLAIRTVCWEHPAAAQLKRWHLQLYHDSRQRIEHVVEQLSVKVRRNKTYARRPS